MYDWFQTLTGFSAPYEFEDWENWAGNEVNEFTGDDAYLIAEEIRILSNDQHNAFCNIKSSYYNRRPTHSKSPVYKKDRFLHKQKKIDKKFEKLFQYPTANTSALERAYNKAVRIAAQG